MRSIERDVLRQAPATLQRGMEAVGGRLILTADALLFQPHVLQVQTRSLSLPLRQIVEMQPCWTRLFGVVPIAPTSLAVHANDGNVHRFVIGERKQWMANIASLCGALR
ncbi:hypothetical protein [Xanthomonas campestris]|uniref:hypothetical protein n=1 Tax=Xanthomonas campestris TaxID=339 RepID=UPI001E2C2E7B|nr:hypothetical protein [Xanthomonas campestris]MCC4603797.1 hypothetical protein [Xanthomonas campestris pv. parthenii]